MTTLSDEQLREALKKDFHSLYVKGFTTSWEAERLVRDTEIEVMSLDNLAKLLTSQRQAIIKEVREGAVDVYWDEHNGELVQAVPLAHLDALEKKYNGGEETPKEKR